MEGDPWQIAQACTGIANMNDLLRKDQSPLTSDSDGDDALVFFMV